MKLTMDTAELADCLAHVKDCIIDKTTIPVLKNVLLTAEGGRLAARASSLDIECSSSAPAEVDVPGTLTVDGRRLHAIVADLPKGSTVTVEQDENLLLLKCGRAKCRMQTLPAQDFPAMQGFDGVTFNIPAPDFRALIAATLPSVSTEETRYYLNGVFLHILNGELVAVSTDGHRLCKRAMSLPEGAAGMASVIIPTKAAHLISALLNKKGEAEVRVSDDRIMVTTSDAQVMSRVVDGTYPDYQRVIPRYNGASFVVDAGPLAAAVERARKAGLDDDRKSVAVRFAAGDGGLSVSSTNSGFEAAHEVLDADVRDPSKVVGMNAVYVESVARVFGDVPLELHVEDEGTAVVFTSEATPSQLMVVMPMRL